MTEVVAKDDTVTFEEKHASFSAFTYAFRLTNPNYAFMRRRLYSKRKVQVI